MAGRGAQAGHVLRELRAARAEFFADAINLPDSVTVDTLTTAFRNIGIFLK